MGRRSRPFTKRSLREKDDERFKELAGWMVSEVRFRPGEERTMTISYRAKYPRRLLFRKR